MYDTLFAGGNAYAFLNLSIYIWTGIMSIILFTGIRISRVFVPRSTKIMRYICILAFVYAMADIVELLFCGRIGMLPFILCRLGDFLSFACPYTMGLLLTYFLYDQIEQNVSYEFHYAIPATLYLFFIGMLFVNLFIGFLYTLDDKNNFITGDYYFLSQMPEVVYFIFQLIVLILFYKHLSFWRSIALLIYVLLPLCCLILAAAFYGVSFIMISINLNFVVMFLFIFHDNVEDYERYEKDLADTQMTLTLSQMQPHFLYNALSSISQLCKKDSEKAAIMIDEFAMFLKKNMQDIYAAELISFETELNHLKRYLNIQKMRYGEYMNICYDIKSMDFDLPPLILQPIAENAVRHGISHKPEGGTITVRSSEDTDEYKVVIEDDGVGFEMGKVKDGKVHLGINSIKKRIGMIEGADVAIDSEPGKGTKVTVTIPK